MTIIPEATKKAPRCRKFHGELDPVLFLRLETESFRRGVTPYKLASAVMKAYLSGALVESRTVPAPSPSTSVAGESETGGPSGSRRGPYGADGLDPDGPPVSRPA